MNDSTNPNNPTQVGAKKRPWMILMILLSVAGLVISSELSILHYQAHFVPGHESFCAINDTINCDKVSLSPFSMLGKAPLSSWGILFYMFVLAVSVWGVRSRQEEWAWGLLCPAIAFSVGLSAWLYLISSYVIQALCLMCMGLYLVNGLSAIVCVFGQGSHTGNFRFVFVPVLFALLVGLLAFPVFSPTSSFTTEWTLITIFLAGLLVLLLVWGAIPAFKQTWRGFLAGLFFVFKSPLIGFGLLGLAFVLILATVLFNHQLYARKRPAEVQTEKIAGGHLDISHGHTKEGHPWIGAKNAEIVLVEYSDYECPHCRMAHEAVRDVVREHKDWLRLVHVHMPLDHACNPVIKRPFHQNACLCSLAAICADQQKVFWEFNDLLFVKRCQLSRTDLIDSASKLGLDPKKFALCLEAPDTRKLLDADIAQCFGLVEECRAMGHRFGTPAFVLEGEVIIGVRPKSWWQDRVLQARQEKSSKPLPP